MCVMDAMAAEIVEMVRAAAPGSIARRLAARCLELCLQEVCANDEAFAPLPPSALEDIVRTVSDR